MKAIDLDAFLALPWSTAVRAKLQDAAGQRTTRYLVAVDTGGKLSATLFTREPSAWPDNVVAIWQRPPNTRDKTRRAVELVKAGETPHAAAKAVGVDPAAVYRQLQRQETRGVCPCCGQLLPVRARAGGPASA